MAQRLPASIIVSTTLKDLESASGKGLTGAGSLLPMSELMRLARHANHYLAIFDGGQALALYRSKRLASPGQRIVLYAKDRAARRPARRPAVTCQGIAASSIMCGNGPAPLAPTSTNSPCLRTRPQTPR
ncbi:hypothetical protein B1987_01565 [Mycobacterium kansasii]|nr:hypothetical protein B1987_01565 [Mycobacterium kansasii]